MKDMSKMSKEELIEYAQELEKAKPAPQRLTAKLSPKGAVSLYGLQRFPVTLYANQWNRVFKEGNKIVLDFIKDNQKDLATK